MKHILSISNETMQAFKQSLEANRTNYEIISNIEGRTTFILTLGFQNELFYIGASYGINCLGNSVANTEDKTLSN
jgi:hypothetical protein